VEPVPDVKNYDTIPPASRHGTSVRPAVRPTTVPFWLSATTRQWKGAPAARSAIQGGAHRRGAGGTAREPWSIAVSTSARRAWRPTPEYRRRHVVDCPRLSPTAV
jgi:hypothetical protein